ncbi:spore germination protein GerPE [Paenibacillus aurantius]|uniref:Spore germination protein GerPE n=1 Tax=Paenibacillus aurantius TaxID=2918900 RepID=A0AA96LBB6_9BACL|nr:spore germination protein GerPE [Paenibacillus aurantius]WNQ10008.1 spore germination protein GerPE [Paenibacillus aurantius]
MSRPVFLGFLKVRTVLFSSTVFVGDNRAVIPQTLAIAVLREIPDFLGREGDYRDYPIFGLPVLRLGAEETDAVPRLPCNQSAPIKVGVVNITSISTSGVVQVGSTRVIDSEYRVKQFRQLLPLPEPQAPTTS